MGNISEYIIADQLRYIRALEDWIADTFDTGVNYNHASCNRIMALIESQYGPPNGYASMTDWIENEREKRGMPHDCG
ncbi:MAG TPA: hypothetical protein VLH56_19190 [Dissulfurispiraceae bacterium]|nr:hypothetical protein [Dissulfurispiraceae bacterium]